MTSATNAHASSTCVWSAGHVIVGGLLRQPAKTTTAGKGTHMGKQTEIGRLHNIADPIRAHIPHGVLREAMDAGRLAEANDYNYLGVRDPELLRTSFALAAAVPIIRWARQTADKRDE